MKFHLNKDKLILNKNHISFCDKQPAKSGSSDHKHKTHVRMTKQRGNSTLLSSLHIYIKPHLPCFSNILTHISLSLSLSL